MVKVFYHNDPDGWCSAYWVRKHLENEGISFTESDFIEMNYDKEFPWEILTSGEQVFMVDFSLNDPMNMALLARDYDFTWIDHHASAIEKMSIVYRDYKLKGVRYDGISGCMLTWIYLISGKHFYTDEHIQSAPLFTQYIHLWDTWQWKNEDYSKQCDIESFITRIVASNNASNPLSIWWNAIDDVECATRNMELLVEEGRAMIAFRDGYGKTCCDSIGKIVEFEGFKCFVCNMPKCNSEWFKSVDPSTYDILIPFYYNAQTEQFLISLYSDKIDVSKIAVKYGGGGHFGASGFQCKQLPF